MHSGNQNINLGLVGWGLDWGKEDFLIYFVWVLFIYLFFFSFLGFFIFIKTN
jgi:hypothetical protein